MTPTPDREPIREGIVEAMDDAGNDWMEARDRGGDGLNWANVPLEVLADACLTYLIKRQAFHSDAYAVIKKEGLGNGKS